MKYGSIARQKQQIEPNCALLVEDLPTIETTQRRRQKRLMMLND
jgi:hypothetical protein